MGIFGSARQDMLCHQVETLLSYNTFYFFKHGQKSVGIISAWQAVMVMNFSPLGVSESEVGFIGFVATVVYCGVSPIIAALMDRVKKHFKSTLVFLCVVSTICFVWLWLLCVQVIIQI